MLNGWEIGGGSVRIHRPDVQAKVFESLDISAEDQRKKFGFLLDALQYGAPPHGGIAFGLDRLVTMMAGVDQIRDVIAFPKTQRGQDLLIDAPTPVTEQQLRDLHIASGRATRSKRPELQYDSGAAGRAWYAGPCAASPRLAAAVAIVRWRVCARVAALRSRAPRPASLPESRSPTPPEAREVHALIRAGGPFRYERDGVVFGNREQLLPAQPRGYYHEYTVPTPGATATAARGASSAAARRRRRTRATTRDDHYRVVPEDPRMKLPDLHDLEVAGVHAWTGDAASARGRRDGGEAALFVASTSRASTARRRCSPQLRRASSCPSTSATTGTRSPTRSRTATGSASTAA